MASIYKRKDGKVWRAVVRIKGYPTICNHFERKQEAADWAQEIERRIKNGQYNFDQHKQTRTLADLIERFINDGIIDHHRSAKDTRRHLDYWKSRLGAYALVHITPELLGKERQLLLQNGSRKPATINRYFASLSSLLSYAKELRWIGENPTFNLKKLKESPGRDRVLTEEEIESLLFACKQSKSPYLTCIVFISLTTGARQGEILNLEWRDIDFDNQLATIRQSKNGRPRSIALCEPVIEELKTLLQNRNPKKPLVFASKTAFGRIDIKKAWQQALKRAGIENCRMHDMRHTFCTLAASLGASNLQLATATGHRTLDMLLRYTHLDVKVTKQFTTRIADQILQGELL